MKTKWKCVCGYIHDGESAPAECPKCGAKAEKFTLLDESAAALVERSRRTNALHCRLVDLARQIESVSKQGIEDNLDPGCVSVFKKSLESCYVIMKLAMTEMQGHAAKGKWG
ncbi:MAG: rubredoxin [Planctomycetes bacterium]|nr:rubredoxin [Planctomycetota bacterium]